MGGGEVGACRGRPIEPAYYGRTASLKITWHFSGGDTTSTSDIAIGQQEVSVPAPSSGETIDFVLRVHQFRIGSTNFPAFTLSKSIIG